MEDRHVSDSSLTARVRVSETPIDGSALVAEVARRSTGATVLFLGTVRDHSEGKEGVTHLEYEAYQEEVEAKIEEVVAEAADRWDIEAVAVEHRVGTVELGGVSVGVAVAAGHRDAAFDAARYVIDQLKVRAPIWKKEHWPGGAEWSRGA